MKRALTSLEKKMCTHLKVALEVSSFVAHILHFGILQIQFPWGFSMNKYFTRKEFYETVQSYSCYFIQCKTFWLWAYFFASPLSVVVVQKVGSFDLILWAWRWKAFRSFVAKCDAFWRLPCGNKDLGARYRNCTLLIKWRLKLENKIFLKKTLFLFFFLKAVETKWGL